MAELTGEEYKVAYYVARGLNNKQIADLLQKSESTVKMQLRFAFRKAQVNSRTKLALWFIETYGRTIE